MPITTYAELQTAIADFLNRDDLAATVPTFIALAEAQFARDIDHWRMEKRATVPLTDRYTALPLDFRKPISLHIAGANRALIPIAQQEMQDRRFSHGDAGGIPAYYAVTGGEIELFPTPSGGTLEMLYVSTIPALSVAAPVNWLLTEAPDIYLYASLLQSAPYLRDDERLMTWTSLYSAAASNLNSKSIEAKFGGQGLRMKSGGR